MTPGPIEETIYYRVKVPRKTWTAFKNTITKNQTMNERIIELIDKAIEEHDKKAKAKGGN